MSLGKRIRRHVPFQSDLLGPLELVETLSYYDFPRLFTVRDASGALHLALWADDMDERGDEWMVVPVSPDRLGVIRVGWISLYCAFRYAEGGRCVWIKHPDGGEPVSAWVQLDEVERDLFHADGVRLSLRPGS